MKNLLSLALASLLLLFSASCDKDDDKPEPRNPDTSPKVSVDRFSATAGMLMVRTLTNGLPAANAPINFDTAPFITKGYGPVGQVLYYYNFDIQSQATAPIYVLFKQGASDPVTDQLNIIDVLPGETGYNDFWQVYKVTVPSDYVANTVTSFAEIQQNGYTIEKLNALVNCPVVPDGSTATKRIGTESKALSRGWYKNQVAYYFTFNEKALTVTNDDKVPLSPIYVTFNINPNLPDGGPPSGFKTETGSMQTHNVLATIPADAGYSPLWSVFVFDNAAFSMVNNLATAQSAPILGSGVANVNCPVVMMQ